VSEALDQVLGELNHEVGVKEIRRNQVRLQFNGPRDVKIFREEIAEEGLADG